jgi:hypothetical protein
VASLRKSLCSCAKKTVLTSPNDNFSKKKIPLHFRILKNEKEPICKFKKAVLPSSPSACKKPEILTSFYNQSRKKIPLAEMVNPPPRSKRQTFFCWKK